MAPAMTGRVARKQAVCETEDSHTRSQISASVHAACAEQRMIGGLLNAVNIPGLLNAAIKSFSVCDGNVKHAFACMSSTLVVTLTFAIHSGLSSFLYAESLLFSVSIGLIWYCISRRPTSPPSACDGEFAGGKASSPLDEQCDSFYSAVRAPQSDDVTNLCCMPPTADALPILSPVSSHLVNLIAREPLMSHTASSFAAAAAVRLGRGEGVARALYKDFFSRGFYGCNGDLHSASAPFGAEFLSAAPTLRADLISLCDSRMPLRFVGNAAPPLCGATEKYVLATHEEPAYEVEMVAMPAPGVNDGSWSLCVSSQVGCRMGCAFCETGRMGLLRNLSASEIVAQAYLARHALNLKLSNIVFMGMGEPLDNADAVIAAIRVLTDPLGLAVPLSAITVSTSGEASHVHTLLKALPRVRIAFSIHSADDDVRSRLMPINRRVGLQELADAMRSYVHGTKRRVTIQYVLLRGVNDSEGAASSLGRFLSSVGPFERFHVNLIPYNAQSRPSFEAPTENECKAFKRWLTEQGLFVKIRETRGAEKQAACGQLGNVKLRRTIRLQLEEAEKRREAESTEVDRGATGRDEPFARAAAMAYGRCCSNQQELGW